MKIIALHLLCATFIYLSDSKLRSVHIISRHGIRAPIRTYPSDPYFNEANKIWPNGLSQLTFRGEEQAVNVGEYIRERYRDFYPADSRHALLRSSNVDRCLDTLALIANQLWRSTDSRLYIAPRIYSAPTQLDAMLYTGFTCPAADQAFESYFNSSKITEYLLRNKWLDDIIANHSDLPASMYSTLLVFDNFKAYKAEGLPIPDWGLKYWNQMSKALLDYFNFVFDPPSALRLRTGAFLSELSLRLNQTLSSNITVDPFAKNFFIYTTHDVNIHGITRALRVPQSTHPPFGAAIIFELHEIHGRNNVRVFYLNHTESLPIHGHQLELPECGSTDCPLDVFTSLISPLFPDIKSECGFTESFDSHSIVQQTLTESLHS